MKLYLKNCFLAFLCLYRSKSYGIRKRVVDHPQGSRDGNPLPPTPTLGIHKMTWALISNWLYPLGVTPSQARLQGLTYLGTHYPKTLNKVLWLASLALTIRIMRDMVRESFFLASLRSAKVRIKGLAYRKHSIRDGSRHVCMPSYTKPKEFP